jgi:hypothetical protein
MDMSKFMLPLLIALLGGLFGAVIWPTHERSRENGVNQLEFRKEQYFNYRNHLREHREYARRRTQIFEQWCSERECSPAEEMNLRMAQGELNKWAKRVENYTEENKHMGR